MIPTKNIFIPAKESMRNLFQGFLYVESLITHEEYYITDNKDDATYASCNIFYVSQLLEELTPAELEKFDSVILFDLFHAWDGMNAYGIEQAQAILEYSPNSTVKLMTQNLCAEHEIDGIEVIKYGTMFNFCKLYYSGLGDSSKGLFHYSADDNYYDIPLKEICTANRTKKFLCLNKTYAEDRPHRWLLDKLMSERKDGYYGNPSRGMFINSNVDSNGKNFSPPATKYFKDVFFSIYCETCTIEAGNFSPTEKTFVPLMMGLFILPFSNQYFIWQLTELGFKMPSFINYSFDGIEDTDERWKAYTDEVNRLLDLPVEDLELLYYHNIDVIAHNKKLLKNKSFFSILNAFN